MIEAHSVTLDLPTIEIVKERYVRRESGNDEYKGIFADGHAEGFPIGFNNKHLLDRDFTVLLLT